MRNLIAFTLLIVCFSVSECKKPKNAAVYDFTWTANPTVDDDLVFTSNVPAGTAVVWNFGDGGTSTYPVGTHFYDSAGVYTVSLVINGDDQHRVIKSVSVGGSPRFYYRGAQVAGDTIYFYTNVRPGSTFVWNFGDGTTSTLSTPYHIYVDTGTYFVKLNINERSSNVKCDTPGIKIYPKVLNYAKTMAGEWNFSGHNIFCHLVCDTTYYNNAQVEIKCISPISISLTGLAIFRYINDDGILFYKSYSDSLIVFENFYSGAAGGIGNATLAINYITNQLTYWCSSSAISHSESSVLFSSR